MTRSDIPASGRRRRVRRAALLSALWLFGLFTTALLVGIWGRAVTSDGETIQAGTRAVLESDAVADRITGWIEDGITTAVAEDLPAGVAAEAAVAVWDRPETSAVLAATANRLVAAALAPPGSAVPVDLAAALRPLVPVVLGELAARGIPVDQATVDAAFAEVPTVVLESEAEVRVAAAVAGARSLLTRVIALGLVGMAISGTAAIVLAEEHVRQVRGLAVRVLVSSLTFSILLRVGAWALDPRGGRSPLAAGGSVFLASSGHVLALAALAAGAVATAATLMVRRRQRRVAA